MGCMPQHGFLGPKKPTRQVYAELIEMLHEQAVNLDPQDGQQTNYFTVKKRLKSKGLLKKLTDNLSSHKSKIQECLNYNMKLVSATLITEQTKYAGLIIVNEIFGNIDKEINDGKERRASQMNNPGEKNDGLGYNSREFKNYDQIMTGPQKGNRLEVQYFKFIIYLLERQNTMYLDILDSLNIFCRSINQKFINKMQAWKILNIIAAHIWKAQEVQKSSRIYLTLLQKIKEGGKDDYIQEKDITNFINLWLVKQNPQSPLKKVADQAKRDYILQIIKLFLERCLTNWDYRVIFRALFNIYDQQQFEGNTIFVMEELFINIIKQNDLNPQSKKAYLLYLFQYLSFTIISKQNVLNNLDQQYTTVRYPNILNSRTKINGFKTIVRLSQSGYIDLNESISYSSFVIVRSFMANIIQNGESTKQIILCYLDLSKLIKSQSNLVLINLLFQQIFQLKNSIFVRQTVLKIIRQVLQSQQILSNPLPSNINFFRSIQPAFSLQQKQQYIQLIVYILKNMQVEELASSIISLQGKTQKLCYFMYSIYDDMIKMNENIFQQESEQILQIFIYSSFIVDILQCLIEKKLYHFAYSYIECLYNQIQITIMSNLVPGITQFYFQLFIFYAGINALKEKQNEENDENFELFLQINNKMKQINKSSIVQIKQQIANLISFLLGEDYSSSNRLLQQSNKIMLKIKQNKVSNEQYEMIFGMLQNYFKLIKKTEQNTHYSLYLSTKNQFRRQSIHGSFYQSNCDRSRNQYEQSSFKNVINHINDT